MKSSMAEGLATWSAKQFSARGIPTKETIKLYQSWGEGENSFGIINTGNIAVEYDMMNSVGDMVITIKDSPVGPRFEAFKALATAAKAHGSLILGQVAHPGGQLFERIRKDTFAPSAIQLPPLEQYGAYALTREATQADIDHVVFSFAHAAGYLAAAGFDGMELHGGHGYLLAQLLSRRFNKRTDAYGGSLMSRLRIILDAATAVRGSPGVPKDFILALKLNSVEFQDGGMTPSEARDMCAALADAEFDFIELTGGNWENFGMAWERESTLKREGFFLEFADVVVPGLGPTPRRTKAFITGGMRSAAAMVDALKTVDGVGLSRPAAQEPRIARDILEGRITSAIRPIEGLEDLGRGFRLAGTHLTQIGKGEEPFDASNKQMAENYLRDFDKWYKDLLDDGDKLEHHGYINLSTKQRPYGQTY